MSKPSDDFQPGDWEPPSSEIEEPSSSKKSSGFKAGEPAPAKYFNWFWEKAVDWLEYLDFADNGEFTTQTDDSSSADIRWTHTDTGTGELQGDIVRGVSEVTVSDSGDIIGDPNGRIDSDGGPIQSGGGTIDADGGEIKSGGGVIDTEGGEIRSGTGEIKSEGGDINSGLGTVVSSSDVDAPNTVTWAGTVDDSGGATIVGGAGVDGINARVENGNNDEWTLHLDNTYEYSDAEEASGKVHPVATLNGLARAKAMVEQISVASGEVIITFEAISTVDDDGDGNLDSHQETAGQTFHIQVVMHP